MQVPKLDKIVINMCVPEATQDSKKVQAAYDDLIAIAGQTLPKTSNYKS